MASNWRLGETHIKAKDILRNSADTNHFNALNTHIHTTVDISHPMLLQSYTQVCIANTKKKRRKETHRVTLFN